MLKKFYKNRRRVFITSAFTIILFLLLLNLLIYFSKPQIDTSRSQAIESITTIPSTEIKSPNEELKLELDNGILKSENFDFQYNDVTNAKFLSNEDVLFQTNSNDYGVFIYQIDQDQLTKIIDSTDQDIYKNIALINTDEYFFIEPKTGKYGIGSITSQEKKYLGQKIYETGRIDQDNIAAFSDPLIIPENENTIFLVKREIQNDHVKVYLEAYNLDNDELTNPTYSYELGKDYGASTKLSLDGTTLSVEGYDFSKRITDIN